MQLSRQCKRRLQCLKAETFAKAIDKVTPCYYNLNYALQNTHCKTCILHSEDTEMEYDLSDLKPFLDKEGRLISLPAKHKKKLKDHNMEGNECE